MKKSLTLFVLFVSILASKAQTVTLYTQDFGDANNLIFPAGWTTTDNGWYVDNTNISQGYDNASGQANMVIKNTSPTGDYYLTTGGIETTGYENIKVIWGRRISNNFTIFSSLPTFEFSTNNGDTWNNVTFTDAFDNNAWALTNTGSEITLPTAADDKASVLFRWKVSITNNPDGTYRIDDFTVKGTVKQTTTNTNTTIPGSYFTITSINNQLLIQNKSDDYMNAAIYSIDGKLLQSLQVNPYSNTTTSGNMLPSGLYIVTLSNQKEHYSIKLSIF